MKTEFTPTTLGMLRSFAIFRASFKKLSKPFSTPDFCMTALFVIILIDQWEKAKNHSPALLGGAIALVCLAIFGGQSFMLPALVLTSAVLLIPGRKGARAK